MKRISQHKLLATGESFAQCRSQVLHFFEKTTLVRYDSIEVREGESFSGLDADFTRQANLAISHNRQMLQYLISDLVKAGFTDINKIDTLPQGYESKTLHIISHILDGFIGIDSYFYNLIDDSHWILSQTNEDLTQHPEKYWLIHVDCFTATPEEASLLHK